MEKTKIQNIMSAGLALVLAAYSISACNTTLSSPKPENCKTQASFMDSDNFTIRERVIELMPTYDLVSDENCDMGTMSRKFFTFTRTTDLEANDTDLGKIETKIISLGYDMTVYDENGNVISTIDHKLIDSLKNWGGYYIEIKNPSGQLVGTMKQDPFALWEKSNWKYFEVSSPDGETLATIEYTAFIPDTYHVKNNSNIDNRTLSGIVSILDQIQDEYSSSSD